MIIPAQGQDKNNSSFSAYSQDVPSDRTVEEMRQQRTGTMGKGVGEKISACLLTYNHANIIDSTLESILDQTITGYEVIVSDDCSTDGTWERILAIAGKDERIRPIRTPGNMGMAGNANFAVAQSSRPYVALLHHDDIYRRDLLEKWSDILERYPDVGFVFNQYAPFPVSKGDRFVGERLDGKRFLEKILLPRWGCPVRGTAMIRRTCWDTVGGMQEKFELLADVDLWMRLSNISQVGYVAEPLIHVRALRPEYYPEIYMGRKFIWHRQVLGYEIHASNRLNFLDLNTLKGKLQWWGFRVKLSSETVKWLGYGVAKRKWPVIETSQESVTQYDLWPLPAIRYVLQFFVRFVVRRPVKHLGLKG